MADEIKVDWSRFETALVKRIASSKRETLHILTEQARGITARITSITPAAKPASIAADIRKVYGTPAMAYAEIQRRGDPRADQFWFIHKKGGIRTAADLFHDITGSQLYEFDGGTAHQRARKRGKVNLRRPLFFIRDEQPLKDYIREMQQRRDWLRSGWGPVARKLGGSYAAGVLRHATSPGSAEIVITADRLSVRAVNGVGYASNTDLERRVQFAINAQAGAMERAFERYEETLNRRAGL